MAELKVVSGPGSGRVVALEADRALLLGRGAPPATPEPGAEHVQIDDKRLSRVHCGVAHSGAGWLVRDLGSSNGTFVNGERITERTLAPGDLVQAGGTIFEVVGLEEARSEPPPAASPAAAAPELETQPDSDSDPLDSPEAAIQPERQPVRRLARRRRSSSAGAIGYAIFAAGVCLAGWVAYTALGPKSNDPATGTLDSPKPAHQGSSSAARPSASAPADSVLPDDDPSAAVEAPLLAGDFRRAMSLVDETLHGPLRGRTVELRKRVNDAAVSELAKRMKEAERLTGAGNYAAARAELEDLLPRLPDDLAADVGVALERVRRLEEAGHKSTDAAVPVVKRQPLEPISSKRLVDLQVSFRQLSGNGATSRAAWASLRDEVGALAREMRSDPSFRSEREKLRNLFAACTAKAYDPALINSFFSARSVALKDGRLTLIYDFTADDQLRDFRAVGNGSAVRREGNALVLRGECRMLQGEPFEGSLTVRGKVGADGYNATAPNINLALFTREKDRLTDDKKPAPSLFLAFVRGTGPEPSDFAAFCLGYRAVTADYDGKPLEQITPEGSTDPIKMPVHTVLTGKHGALIHSDARECLWAVPSGGVPRGPVAFEIVIDRETLAWTVNGKPLIDAKDPRFVRLRALNEPAGSVTLFTRRSEVRFTSIELEGRLSEAWLREAVGKSAEAELEKIERG